MDKHELEIAGCLRRLFRSRYVVRTRNERWFQTIIEHRNRVQEVVEAFAARLEINEPLGVIYLQPANEEVEEKLAFRLARSRALSPFASALMLQLRWQRLQFYLQPTGDDVPVIGVTEMREFLAPFSRSKIDAQFERQFRRALDELGELQVLIETSGGSGFFEISSLCDLLLPADEIKETKARADRYFSALNGQDADADEQTQKASNGEQ